MERVARQRNVTSLREAFDCSEGEATLSRLRVKTYDGIHGILEVGQHRAFGGGAVALHNRVEDRLVGLLHLLARLHGALTLQSCPDRIGEGRANGGNDMVEDGVVCGLGHLHVELHVEVHIAIRVVEVLAHGLDDVRHPGQLLVGSALGRQPGALHLEPLAHFQDFQDRPLLDL